MKNNKLFKKSISLLVAFVMMLGFLLFLELQPAAAATTENVGTFEQLKTAIEKFNSGDSDMTINVTDNIVIGNENEQSNGDILPLIVNDGKTLTISSNAAAIREIKFYYIVLSSLINGRPVTLKDMSFFYVGEGTTLVFENISILGNANVNNEASLVAVDTGGRFVMNTGATLTGNYSKNTPGAGVFVNVGADFTMNGGTISGNESTHGGGVVLFYPATPATGSGATFTMNGGTISGNIAQVDGGGVAITGADSGTGGTFIMNGGTIKGNTAGTNPISHNASSSGGGVHVGQNGTFIMNGGEISGNNAITVRVNDKSTGGGGVSIEKSTFIMNGGTISNNTAKEFGGGVLLPAGDTDSIAKFLIGGNAVISGNSVGSGVTNNVHLALPYPTDFVYMDLNTGANAPRSGMSVGVTREFTTHNNVTTNDVIVASGAAESQAQYFIADNPEYVVIYNAEIEVSEADVNIVQLKNVLRIVERKDTRSITYRANGGSGNMADGYVLTGGSYTLRANGFTRPGFEFRGWNTAADGRGTPYANNVEIPAVNSNITLYAQWWSGDIPAELDTPVWTGTGNVTVKIDADYQSFVRLLMNGSVVANYNYTVAAGSTIITLKESFLSTLTKGTHVFDAEFIDGIAIFELTIGSDGSDDSDDPNDPDDPDDSDNPDVPKTGDSNAAKIWIALLLISTLAIILIPFKFIKKSNIESNTT
ncbi:MAG: InlB B-repeat-containing protein [Oscillospiraceae bacterium]|jgi:uncharacterized repeat protein (TIGR02543 family)|nr:InlB B-repeat-containing protein [Oscillospiraceae bacterium]